MKARLGLLLLAFAMLSARSAWSQAGVLDLPENPLPDSSQQSSDSSQQSSDSSQQSAGPQPAYTHPEQLPPLGLLGEVASETGLRFGASQRERSTIPAEALALHHSPLLFLSRTQHRHYPDSSDASLDRLLQRWAFSEPTIRFEFLLYTSSWLKRDSIDILYQFSLTLAVACPRGLLLL